MVILTSALIMGYLKRAIKCFAMRPTSHNSISAYSGDVRSCGEFVCDLTDLPFWMLEAVDDDTGYIMVLQVAIPD